MNLRFLSAALLTASVVASPMAAAVSFDSAVSYTHLTLPTILLV